MRVPTIPRGTLYSHSRDPAIRRSTREGPNGPLVRLGVPSAMLSTESRVENPERLRVSFRRYIIV